MPGNTLRIDLPDVLSRLQPLCTLSASRRNELASQCSVEHCYCGKVFLDWKHFRGQSVYLLDGELKLGFADGSTSVRVGNTEETCWALGKCSQSEVLSAKAITDITLLRIDDKVLDIMMTWDQMPIVQRNTGEETESADWHLVSGAFPLQSLIMGVLSNLPSANIDALFRRFERAHFATGEIILREGDEGDYYYIIESGRCTVTRRVGGVDMLLAELNPGAAFGEEALLGEGKRRNATVCMKHGGVLLRLGKQDFVEMLQEPLLRRTTRNKAEERITAGALWIDARSPSEYQHSHLSNALNIPLAEIRNAIGVLDRSREYVVYCQSGRRSSAAAFLLSQHGYDAAWLEDGLQSCPTL